jgi:hypothetical protein
MLNNNKIELTKFYANLVVKQYNGKMIMISSYMANSKKNSPCLKIMAHMSYNQLLTEIIFLEGSYDILPLFRNISLYIKSISIPNYLT